MLQNVQKASGGNRHPLCSELHVNGFVLRELVHSAVIIDLKVGSFEFLCLGYQFR